VIGLGRLAGTVAAALLILLAGLPAARAHEVRPAYLELKETAPGQFSVIWRTPVLAGMRLPVALKLPEGVRNVEEPSVQELSGSLLERRSVDAGPAGFAGKRIEFPGLQLTITDVLVRVERLDGTHFTELVRSSRPWLEIAAPRGVLATAGAFFAQGVEHILLGFDHLLFVLGLIFLVSDWRPLILTVTAFTVAHSITLAAAALGFVNVPQAPVEAAIALSIMFVAAEILRATRGEAGLAKRYPWVVAFAFGLLHGFGFAGALREVGLPEQDIAVALLFFNVGVEAGQLLFIAAAVTVLAIVTRAMDSRDNVRREPWPAEVLLRKPVAYAIGSVAAFWVIQRIAAF
jgi:hypothetical protein